MKLYATIKEAMITDDGDMILAGTECQVMGRADGYADCVDRNVPETEHVAVQVAAYVFPGRWEGDNGDHAPQVNSGLFVDVPLRKLAFHRTVT